MATDWNEMNQYFSDQTAENEFRPCAHYDADSDAIAFYFSNVPDYGKRLNSRVTIYLSDETGELVGCRVKGVRTVLEDIGWFDVSVAHGKVKLTMLFVAFHSDFTSDPDSRRLYREIGRAASESGIEVEVPEYVSK